MSKEDLDLVKRYQKEIILLGKSKGLLEWDQLTHMPKKGINVRAEQKAYLSGLIHKKMTSDELFNAIKRLKEKKNLLDEEDNIMIKKLHRQLVKSRKLPAEFVEELSRTISLSMKAWEEARIKKDFSIFEPHLEKVIKLKRKEAEYINLPGHSYNSLLDDYEEGMTVEEILPILEKLKNDLIGIIKKIKSTDKYKKQKLVSLKKEFPREIQIEFFRDVIKRIGLDESFSRIDFSEHPCTYGIDPEDIRLTTNIRKSPLFSFGSSIHETGHGLYESGLPIKHRYDILCNAPSMGIHESQSRFWELMIGLNKPFWRFYFPKFNDKYKLNTTFDKWYEEINLIEPGNVRIETNEVFYNLHIILRFELELGLIEGKINVKDLPKIWNQKMKELIGIEPQNDVEGVLQDCHWSQGLFGYFPTYSLGTIYAAQIYNTLKKEILDIEKYIEKGDFGKISEWLKEKIHKHGTKYLAEDLIKKVCGEGLNPNALINYLNKKYSEVYGFKE